MEYQQQFQQRNQIQRYRKERETVHRQLLEIQKKSKVVSNPEDEQEKEADNIARKVVNGESTTFGTSGSGINRKGEGDTKTSPEFEQKLDSSKGGGQNLPSDIHSEMGEKMGADFSGVKVHTGSEANAMSENINAKAFTHGQDIYFGKGQYDTKSKEGKELLAHELAHTVQQNNDVQRKIQRQPGGQKPRIDMYDGTGDIDVKLEPNDEIVSVSVKNSSGKFIYDDTSIKGAYKTLYTVSFNLEDPTGQYEVWIMSKKKFQEFKVFHKEGSSGPYVTIKVRIAPGAVGEHVDENHPEEATGDPNNRRYVVYKNEIRWKGSNAWRNNNPGNISVPTPRGKFGEIGYDNHSPKLSIFPDYATGWTALHTLLTTTYANSTILSTMNHYDPNTGPRYANTISSQTGLAITTKIKDMNETQVTSLMNAIKTVEGTSEGIIFKSGDAKNPQWVKDLFQS